MISVGSMMKTSSLPTLPLGGPQTITETIYNIHNTTGKVAHLYAWINLNGDADSLLMRLKIPPTVYRQCNFRAWAGVTISGQDSNRMIRVRLK
ncbi:MAG: hypothetical protein U0T81_04175 [Saprospiraceae bacterium]